MTVAIQKYEILPIRSDQDVAQVRTLTRTRAIEVNFSLIQQTKLVTGVSEIARNSYLYGKQGTARLEVLDKMGQAGIRLIFIDKGPGIPDIEQAMQDGYTTGRGLGLGLSGTRRLVDEFQIESKIFQGTRVTITMWK
jgi:serine/threonine-protein kinase RsbT